MIGPAIVFVGQTESVVITSRIHHITVNRIRRETQSRVERNLNDMSELVGVHFFTYVTTSKALCSMISLDWQRYTGANITVYMWTWTTRTRLFQKYHSDDSNWFGDMRIYKAYLLYLALELTTTRNKRSKLIYI